jgi:hypothetical protein
MNGNIAQMQGNILFWIIIALFAWQGYQRGIWSELIKMIFVVGGLLLGTPAWLGLTLVKAINGIFLSLQFLIHGGLKAVITGNFNANALSKIFETISRIPPPVSAQNMELAMFLVMLFLVIIGYLASKFIKKNAMPGLGMVAGIINGFLLSYIFLPLLPRKSPFTISDLSPAGIIKQLTALFGYIVGSILLLLSSTFKFLFSLFGAWTIPLLIFLIIVIVLSSLKKTTKKSSNGGC